MDLLLINKNPVVSRMLNLSAPKAGFEVSECDNVYELPKGSFDVVLIDDEMYDENFLKEIKSELDFKQLGIITSAKNADTESFDFVLIKPFLPTDLIELLRSIRAKIEFTQYEDVSEETEEIVELEESDEEEPFVPEEEVEKSGVLNEEEIERVAELLEDTPESILTAPKEEESQEETIEEETRSIQEEEEKPSILEKMDIMENVPPKEPSEPKEEPETKSAPVPDPQEYSSEEKIKALMGVLDLYTVRELLDGMEITIKINFNKKKKKKR